jgi:hypothetical protein
MNVQRPWSRFQTSRLTSAGMWRESLPEPLGVRLGRAVAANLRRSSSGIAASSTSASTWARSPAGTRCDSNSAAWRSLACVGSSSVTWSP